MRKKTAFTVFYTLIRVFKTTAAIFPQSVERTIAEDTIKILNILGGMTRKILAIPMLEKFKIFRVPMSPGHNLHRIHTDTDGFNIQIHKFFLDILTDDRMPVNIFQTHGLDDSAHENHVGDLMISQLLS